MVDRGPLGPRTKKSNQIKMEENIRNLYKDFSDKRRFVEVAEKELGVGFSSLYQFFGGHKRAFKKIRSQLPRLHQLAVNYHKMELERHRQVHEANA